MADAWGAGIGGVRHRYGDRLDRDDRLLLGSSFGTAAVAYAEHRPDYAQAAVRWTLERAPGRRVLDLGAGTGKLTAALLALGAEVIAVEPDPAMLTELRRALPAVRWRRGKLPRPSRIPPQRVLGRRRLAGGNAAVLPRRRDR